MTYLKIFTKETMENQHMNQIKSYLNISHRDMQNMGNVRNTLKKYYKPL